MSIQVYTHFCRYALGYTCARAKPLPHVLHLCTCHCIYVHAYTHALTRLCYPTAGPVTGGLLELIARVFGFVHLLRALPSLKLYTTHLEEARPAEHGAGAVITDA